MEKVYRTVIIDDEESAIDTRVRDKFCSKERELV